MRFAITGLPTGSNVLDAACGIGVDAAALHRRGHRIVAADASPAMTTATRARLAGAGAHDPEVVTAEWTDLPGRLGIDRFDTVLCVGNSFAHAESDAAAVAALAAFRRLVRPGGQLVLDSLDWERMAELGDHATVEPDLVEREGLRCIRLHSWWAPGGPGRPWSLDAGLVFIDGDQVTRRSHRVELHPFTRRDLRRRLTEAGWTAVAIDGGQGEDRYTATARRPG